MQENRKRSHSLTIRLTAEEKELLKSRAQAKKTTLTDYVLWLALGKDCSETSLAKGILMKLTDLESMVREKEIGADSGMRDVLDLQNKIRQEVCGMVRNG